PAPACRGRALARRDPPRAGAFQTSSPLDRKRRKSVEKRSVTVAAVDAEALEREAQGAIAAASTRAELEDARVRYLGRKSELKQALRTVRDREAGMTLNAVRERLESAFAAREAQLERAEPDRALTEETADVTLPGPD